MVPSRQEECALDCGAAASVPGDAARTDWLRREKPDAGRASHDWQADLEEAQGLNVQGLARFRCRRHTRAACMVPSRSCTQSTREPHARRYGRATGVAMKLARTVTSRHSGKLGRSVRVATLKRRASPGSKLAGTYTTSSSWTTLFIRIFRPNANESPNESPNFSYLPVRTARMWFS